MENLSEELQEWIQQENIKNMERVYGRKREHVSPRIKAFNDYCHHRLSGHWFCKDSKWLRKNNEKKFRRKMKRKQYDEAYYRIRPRDYKTYGYLSW